MSQLTICQSPFGLKPSLSGKCSGFRNPSPQGGRWGSLLCLHGKEEWSQTSSCRLLGALGVHTGPAGSRIFPVLLVLAQLASAPGNFRPLFSQFGDGLLGLSFESTHLVPHSLLKSGCDPHVLTGLDFPWLQGHFAPPWRPLWLSWLSSKSVTFQFLL